MTFDKKIHYQNAISRNILVAVIVIIIVLIVGSYAALNESKNTLSQSTSMSNTSSSLSSQSSQSTLSSTSISSTQSSDSQSSASTLSQVTNETVPQSLTYETTQTPQYLDPAMAYSNIFDSNLMYQTYEPLVWYEGANATAVIPWLAQNYTISPDGKTVNFVLRSGIHFQDGEALNSTAVYFSLNRLLVEDGSVPSGHAIGPSWILEQLANTSLGYNFGAHAYTQKWLSQVLAQDFVQITGPLSFTLHIQNPQGALLYILAGTWCDILAPDYIMSHDLALWSQQSTGYSLPNPSPNGNATTMINQYFMDEVATCNTGITPGGCGTTYLDASSDGSTAGTGPYVMQNVSLSTNDIVFQSNPNYWGGPYQFNGGSKIEAQIKTIDVLYTPSLQTREVDLQSAAASGKALAIDVPNDHLYDIANRSDWLNSGKLSSIISGADIYGPYIPFGVGVIPFATNVTNPQTDSFFAFQPFADLRFRLAFADAVNLTEINQDINNNLGRIATEAWMPNLPPTGSFNSSLTTRYSYNLTAVQNFLLDAMLHPITSFTFLNGSAAAPGSFNNTFGCSSLNANNQCSHPVLQSITLTYVAGDTVDSSIFTQIATAINNISSTYNMGLTVSTVPLPLGQELTEGSSGYLYMWNIGGCCFSDYPWVVDQILGILAPGGPDTSPEGWNLTSMELLTQQINTANGVNNISGILQIANKMAINANNAVEFLWSFYPYTFQIMTSNVQGYYDNSALYGTLQYFAALH
jgi:ABC-type transport system substrate-binding protein